ncbi:MAG TPA: family 2 glycosyl transferase [Prolixibacteraceae bacterium]|nr:family 2 glycosyl transferase [Prolixibacteraceae bacterium]
MFANDYLSKNNRSRIISENPDADCRTIVVIPCHNEPNILHTLQSLKNCISPAGITEVLIIINHSEKAETEIKEKNQRTLEEVSAWITENYTQKLKFFVIGPVELREKWAGVGLARKTGMDEAVARFNFLNNRRGIVVSLDADTLVAENYLIEIEKHFKQNHTHVGATIAFEHQKEGLSEKQLRGIELYEQYLKYYKDALSYTGYPFSMFTVGSAFAVSAEAYVKRGGMNRRQAGEDFYFLQNLVQLGTVGEITSTKVYPSARSSNRVPFGTGAAMQKWIDGTEDLTQTYNFQAFIELKEFFDIKEKLFKVSETEQKQIIGNLPDAISSFIESDNFYAELADLNKNCSNLKTFQTRFFYQFNAFKVLKYLNFTHEKHFEKADLIDQIIALNETKNSCYIH